MNKSTMSLVAKIVTAVFLTLTYVYTTFATKSDVKIYVDLKNEGVMKRLDDIHGDVKTLTEYLLKKGSK